MGAAIDMGVVSSCGGGNKVVGMDVAVVVVEKGQVR